MSNFWCLFNKDNDGSVVFYRKGDGATADYLQADRFTTSVDAEHASPDRTVWRTMFVNWMNEMVPRTLPEVG